MRIRSTALALLLISGAALATDLDNVKVTSVYDGDTFKIQVPNVPAVFGENLGVRIRGIDTPKMSTKNQCEKKLAIYVKGIVEAQLMKAKRVDLKNCSRDKYFRLLCDPFADGIAVKTNLLKKGYAYEYHGKTKEKINWCNRLPASLK
jgi:endonuclease YncB( thermonuclease family)